MKIAPVVDVKARLSAYLEECEKSPVLITKNGRPKALLLSVPEDEEDLERFLLAHNPKFMKILEDAERNIRETGGIPHEQFWTEVEREAAKPPRRPARKKRR
jgi:prevent-host-death family protein